MTSRTPLLMLLAVAVLGVYVLPAVTARFAGSHTMELNQSGRIEALDCEKCHTYILDELGTTSIATDILTAHRTAATEADYVNGSGILNITESDALADVNRSACLLCHLITRNATGAINQTHTKVTIRVCDDNQCHGAGVEDAGDITHGGVNAAWATDALNVTDKLRTPEDAHSRFYEPILTADADSMYVDQTGESQYGSGTTGNYSKSFYACLACHTHVGFDFNLTRPNTVWVNFTASVSGNYVSFDYETAGVGAAANTTVGQKTQGSVWS